MPVRLNIPTEVIWDPILDNYRDNMKSCVTWALCVLLCYQLNCSSLLGFQAWNGTKMVLIFWRHRSWKVHIFYYKHLNGNPGCKWLHDSCMGQCGLMSNYFYLPLLLCTESQMWLVFCVADRDPSKRRVKPVDPHLLQLEFAGIGSSSDDSDFKVVTDDESGANDIFILLDCYLVSCCWCE